MVKIVHLNSVIKVKRDWHDYSEQLVILSVFEVALIIGIIYSYVRIGLIQYFMIFLLIGAFFIFLYYLLQSAEIIFDLSNNLWRIIRKSFGIPYLKIERRIDEISYLIAYESIETQNQNIPIYENRKNTYFSAFQIWGFKDQDDEREINTVFSFKTKNYLNHKKEMQQNEMIGKALETYFKKLGIPIDFNLVNEKNLPQNKK